MSPTSSRPGRPHPGSPELQRPPLRELLHGVGSPGPYGYGIQLLLGVLFTDLLLALQLIVGGRDSLGEDTSTTIVGVLTLGLVFMLPVGLVAVIPLHLLTLNTDKQWIHVLVAGVVTVIAASVVWRHPLLALLLAVAFALARATVIRFARDYNPVAT